METTMMTPDMNVSANVSTLNETGMQLPVKEIPVEDQVRETVLFQIAMALHFYYLPVIVVVGLVGNSLTLTVMLQKKNRMISCCFYMAHLAASDCLVLLYGAFTFFDARFQLIPKTDLSCGLSNLVLGLVSNYNIMILVALAFDRFLAIRFPLRSPVLCTVKRAKVTLLMLGILSAALTIPVAFTATSPDGRVCAAHSSGSVLDQVHSVLSLIVFSIAPFAILLFMNGAIIAVILGRRKMLESLRNQQGASANEDNGPVKTTASNRDVQLAVMLIAITFVFLLLILPLNVRYILGSVYDYKKNVDAFAIYYIILVVSAKTHITNSGVNFFLYCLSGAKFRDDVFKLIRCGAYHKYMQRRSPLEVTGKPKGFPSDTSLSTISASVTNVTIGSVDNVA